MTEGHKADCAVFSTPAKAPGPCDCGYQAADLIDAQAARIAELEAVQPGYQPWPAPKKEGLNIMAYFPYCHLWRTIRLVRGDWIFAASGLYLHPDHQPTHWDATLPPPPAQEK